MKNLFEEYFTFILYAIVSLIVVTIFLNIIEGPQLNYGLNTDALNDETSIKGEYDDIAARDVYFNILGRPLVYNTHFNWNDYVIFDDGQPYKNDDGYENMSAEHCFALVNGEKVDLTDYVTPADYTNVTEVGSTSYLNETPKESEAKITIVPYILNWENIHIKKNVAFFVLPNDMLLTFCGRAYMPDGVTPFRNKRILYKKGHIDMAISETDANGYFVIGIKNSAQPEDLNNSNILPVGDYTFAIDADGGVYTKSYSEDSFDLTNPIINLGNIALG